MKWIFLLFFLGLEANRPNVIVIVSDDLGFHDMPWNNRHVIAPNLIYLAESGTIFNDFYVQSVCTPSRAALMTSRYLIFQSVCLLLNFPDIR